MNDRSINFFLSIELSVDQFLTLIEIEIIDQIFLIERQVWTYIE